MVKILSLITLYIFSIAIFAVHPGITIGNEYLKVKDYKKAYDSYSDVLMENPKNKSALYGKSYSLFKMKKYDDAINSFEELLKIDKYFKDSLYRTAFLYRKVKKYDKAISYYELYLKKFKNDPDTYYGLARTYEKKDNIVKATYNFYLYTVKENRPSEDKWVKKAQKKIENYRAKFNTNQQKEYEKLVANTKKDSKKILVKGNITKKDVVKTGNSNGALSSHKNKDDKSVIPKLAKNSKKVDSTNDRNLDYMFMKGIKADDLYLNKKYNDAIIAYRSYLTNPLKRREGLYKMAISNALLKRYSTAVNLLSQIIIEETSNTQVKELLKLLLSNKTVIESLKGADSSIQNKIGMKKVNELIARGDYFEAIKILDILSANIKNNSSALLYKIDLLRILSKDKEIENSLKSFLTNYPDNVLVNEKYGDYLATKNKKEEALKYYKIAISKTKDKEIKSRLNTKISSK